MDELVSDDRFTELVRSVRTVSEKQEEESSNVSQTLRSVDGRLGKAEAALQSLSYVDLSNAVQKLTSRVEKTAEVSSAITQTLQVLDGRLVDTEHRLEQVSAETAPKELTTNALDALQLLEEQQLECELRRIMAAGQQQLGFFQLRQIVLRRMEGHGRW